MRMPFLFIQDVECPSCMTKEEYESWREATRSGTHFEVRAAGICTDCNPSFALSNHMKGKCDYWYQIIFRRDSSGSWIGRLRSEEAQSTVRERKEEEGSDSEGVDFTDESETTGTDDVIAEQVI
jgi:hypothetical protein